MKKTNHVLIALSVGLLLAFPSIGASAQQSERYSLQQCLEYAIENNHNIKKAGYDKEKALHARREVIGALLPQINASANLNANLKKAKFIMPNFINKMMPAQSQDPNAPKYMTIEMGTTYQTNAGVQLNQQLVNFSLFNTLSITKVAESMATLGAESTEEDVISQTATLYYGIQSTEYAVSKMEESILLMDKMLQMMRTNLEIGIVNKVDVDRLQVNMVNLQTQKTNIESVLEIQKNLLKLQMGYDMEQGIDVDPIDPAHFELQVQQQEHREFSTDSQIPFKLMEQKVKMAQLQKKSAQYEYLPTLSLMFNYQYNGMSDKFFSGSTNYWYPTSVIGVSLRIPIFSGLSRRAKVRENELEVQKALEDQISISQSLRMAYLNAQMKLGDARRTIEVQGENQTLAEEVFKVAENKFSLGLASMSDILNASQSLVQAQINYANALNEYMKAYIELKKAGGHIRELMN